MAKTKLSAKETAPKNDTKLTIDQQVAKKRLELAEARRGLAQGELQNPHSIKTIRREIAKLLTKANAKTKKPADTKKGVTK
jgi:ribosomal protein L29